ncbi:MAG TPA: acylphosphatase [Cyclobacteriaceae bacterium]|nr:acylphosphatase [Cyclobacteriaceae bacterium]
MIHKNIRVKGKVQGVYYRASTVDMAKSLGLKGFVLNEPSGSVYMEAEGDEEQVNQLIEWAAKGPTRAIVEALEITDGAVVGFGAFEIRYSTHR